MGAGVSQGKWEPHEDAQLLELVSRFGKSWVNVGQELGRYNSGPMPPSAHKGSAQPTLKP